MARKRMISPEIWESASFSSLSDLAKLVFISLISHADDEGRGIAKPGYITNLTFPYDENRRVADIKKALSEIALKMSTQFYSVNGIEYYVMTHWKRWQKIDRPTKSKLPPPPATGEGGDISSRELFDESSTNTRRVIDEASPSNRIEYITSNEVMKERKKENNIKRAREDTETAPSEWNGKLVRNEAGQLEKLPSHEDILREFGAPEATIDVYKEFLKHCYVNGHLKTNDALASLIMKLNLAYPDDTRKQRAALKKAINSGYYDVVIT